MSVIGQSVQRLDARDKVIGKTLYPGDINRPNQVMAKTSSPAGPMPESPDWTPRKQKPCPAWWRSSRPKTSRSTSTV